MQLELIGILYILIICQSWLFAFVLFGKTGHKRISNRILGSFLFTLGFQMLLYLLADLGYIGWYQNLVSIVFTYGPLMLLYTRSLIWKEFRLKRTDILHFIPFLLFLGLGLSGYNIRQNAAFMLYLSIGGYLWWCYPTW